MHLSIQRHAHAQAEILVQAWGKQAHVQIAAVRYHILRNGLILKDIHIQRGADEISIEHLFMRTNPALLSNPILHIGAVEISGIKAVLHVSNTAQTDTDQAATQQVSTSQANPSQKKAKPSWQDEPQLMKLWQAITSLKAQHGQLALYLTPPQLPPHLPQPTPTPLIIKNIAIALSTHAKQRTLLATGRLHEGTMQWQHTSSPQDNTSEGQFSWQHVSTSALSDALGLNSIVGHLQGSLTWQHAQPETNKQASFNIQSEMQFNATAMDQHDSNNTAADSNQPSQRLQFSATEQNKLWNIELHAFAWPLSPWSSIIPALSQHQLLTAQLNGVSHWQEKSEGWVIQGDKGALHDVVAAASNDDKPWSWRDIYYDSFHIDSAQHQLRLTQVKLNDGNISFRTAAKPGQDALSNTEPETTLDSTTTAAPKKHTWSISADHIQATNMALSLILPEGEFKLNALQAQATWPQHKALKFKIKTQAVKNNPALAQWQMRGSISRLDASQNSDVNFSMQSKHTPLNRLRLLLALQDDANSPVTLAGTIDLDSRISVHQNMWVMQGKATAYDVQISHAGNRWSSKQVHVQFGPIGMGVETQNVSQLNTQEWLYIAALEPLQPIPIHTPEQVPMPYQSPWWAVALNKQHIQIQHVQLNGGRLSIGHKESIWASNIDIQIDQLMPQDWATVAIKADVSGGDFTLNGEWDALSKPQHFRGSIALDAATPFFLHEWMSASGMPRLIRGRLNAALNINYETKTDAYQSDWQLQLLNGMTETGFFNNDPMLTRSGLNTEYLLNRLSQANGAIKLQGQLNGIWQQESLNINRLGQSLQAALRLAAATEPEATPEIAPATVATHVRLHERQPLSLNERSRLFRIIRQLQNKPDMVVELKPLWSGDALNDDVLTRIQHTQNLIERFLRHRKITRQRIFPRWPTDSDHDDEISSIRIELIN